MSRTFSCLLAILICNCFSVAATAAGRQLVSDPANLASKTYTNPIVFSDYSDPDLTASPDGKVFYMTASSFQCAPGLPILKSVDLVNWELVNYALKSVPPASSHSPRHGKAVWAPTIREHNGEYFIYWGDPDKGVYMVKTSTPEGEWSEPVLVVEGHGIIDSSPLWDEDGRMYMVNGWAASRCGFNSVLTMRELSADGTRAISDPVIVFDGNDGVNHTVEGPKLYKRDGWYWIFAPAGGEVEGWQLAMRSKNIYGPYEHRIVMAQGKSEFNGPHQGGWVETSDGNGWFLHFQDCGAYGRILHLNPLERKNGWPVIGIDADGDGCGEPVKTYKRPLTPDKTLSYDPHQSTLLYEWHANYENTNFGFPIPDGQMRVYGGRMASEFRNFWGLPDLWLQKFPAEEFAVTARVRVSAKEGADSVSSGLIVMGWDYTTLSVTKIGDEFKINRITCIDAEQNTPVDVQEIGVEKPSRIYSAGLKSNYELDMWLRVEVRKDALCTFPTAPMGKNSTGLENFSKHVPENG